MNGIEALIGKTLTKIKNVDNEEIIFTTSDGKEYTMYHAQDCCESVIIDDIVGDLNDLIGDEILVADERISTLDDKDHPKTDYWEESCTWTFYTLRTVNATVDIRWFGTSNGYYSESVDFCESEQVSKY